MISPKNKSDVNKPYIDISNGQKLQLLDTLYNITVVKACSFSRGHNNSAISSKHYDDMRST